MTFQKTWAKIIGIVLLLVGVVGFFMGDQILGFGINTLHNVVHLLTGAIFAWAGFGQGSAKSVNRWLGIVYIVVAVLGFLGMLSFLATNGADNWLHLVIGVVSLLVSMGA